MPLVARVTAVTCSGLVACSALVSLDGLTGGETSSPRDGGVGASRDVHDPLESAPPGDSAPGDALVITDSQPPRDAAADPPDATSVGKRVFVTSATTTGAMGGLDGGDTRCTQAAATAGLRGTWLAWLSAGSSAAGESSTTVDAIGRLPDAGPWRLVDGRLVADSTGALRSGTLSHAIDRDEKGQTVRAGPVWTGTDGNGTYPKARDGTGGACSTWTRTTKAGQHGTSGSLDGKWTAAGRAPCSTQARLYCFEK